jgi:prepilin-type processing-associated H-X9-DG protein
VGKPVWFFSPTKLNAQNAAISVLHKGFANCAFVDGHVQALDRKGLRDTNTQIKLVIGQNKLPVSF